MIDFHNHILPDVDDGPKMIKESIDMLRCAQQQGITDVVNTVHFQHPKMDGRNVEYDYLISKVSELQDTLNKKKINIRIHLSAEVFYLPNLVEISKNPLLTIGNGKYMLIEFTSNIYPQGYEDEFFRLQSNGIIPIVAHPERYRFIQNDLSILKQWIKRGYILQIDAGSILGMFGEKTKKVTCQMVKNNYIHIIGSDAHNNKRRNFCIKDAYDKLSEIKSKEFVDLLSNNLINILKGKKINNIYSNQENDKKKIFTYFKKKFGKL